MGRDTRNMCSLLLLIFLYIGPCSCGQNDLQNIAFSLIQKDGLLLNMKLNSSSDTVGSQRCCSRWRLTWFSLRPLWDVGYFVVVLWRFLSFWRLISLLSKLFSEALLEFLYFSPSFAPLLLNGMSIVFIREWGLVGCWGILPLEVRSVAIWPYLPCFRYG